MGWLFGEKARGLIIIIVPVNHFFGIICWNKLLFIFIGSTNVRAVSTSARMVGAERSVSLAPKFPCGEVHRQG
jgi:hypothetical protein